MRMRERLPFLTGQDRLDREPEAAATADAPAAEDRAGEGEIGTVERLGGAFATIAQERPAVLLVASSAMFYGERRRLAAILAPIRERLGR